MSILAQDDIFADILQRLRASGDDRTFDAAQMQLINLPEVIKNAGPQWPKVKDSLRASSTSFLKGCLEDEDIVLPAGDGFLIIFAQGAPDALKLRAQELREMLLEFYMSNDALKSLGIRLEHRQISARELGALVTPPPTPSAAPTTDSCLFAPVWSAGPKLIASYFCLPVHREVDGPRYGYDAGYVEDGRLRLRDYCQLDLNLLDLAEAALSRAAGEDPRPAIGVSVHSSTMQNRAARAIYLERLAKVPQPLMKHMYLKLAEIELGAPIINLADWVGMLRARTRTIMLEFHHLEVAPPNLNEVGVWGAGFAAPQAFSRDGAELAPVARQFLRWGESLTRQRVRFFLDNLRKPILIKLAAEAGAHFITSDNFWPFQKQPGGIFAAPAPNVANSPFPQGRKPLPSAAT